MDYKSLAVKYRPQIFEDVCGQISLIKILNRQLEIKSFKNCYLFSGPSGCGKTTIARIFANKINNYAGSPIECDGASNNSVDDVRVIVDSSNQRSLDSEYKIYIIDECHMITTAGWNAFLKCIEEPPKFTIFIFCTTDPQKVPETILNRCQVYNLSRIPDDLIKSRLMYISNKEGYTYDDDGLSQIVKLSQGSMRQAISYLDKCKDYDTNITLANVQECLGEFSYDIYFNLTNAIIEKDSSLILRIIDDLYNNGCNLKLFINDYLSFILQLLKFCIFKSFDCISIPKKYSNVLNYTINVEDNVKFFNYLCDKVLNIKQMIKFDTDIKTSIEILLLS